MTLFECLHKYVYEGDTTLASSVPGGMKPRLLPQTNVTQTTLVVRQVSGIIEKPTHDGPSKWSAVRIEFTVWGTSDKTNEQVSLYVMNKIVGFTGYLGGSTNGKFSALYCYGPRSVTDEASRLPGIQFDIAGFLDRSTLS
jgi:hypothetical protein